QPLGPAPDERRRSHGHARAYAGRALGGQSRAALPRHAQRSLLARLRRVDARHALRAPPGDRRIPRLRALAARRARGQPFASPRLRHRPHAAVVKALGLVLLGACEPATSQAPPDVLTITESEQTAAFVRNFNPLLEVGNVRWPARNAMYEPLLI